MPAKSIKRGIKVWMRCDADTAFLNDFNVYLGRSTENTVHGLSYDVVDKLPAAGKNHWLFFDNYFTGVELCVDLLARKTYSCGTVQMNRRGFPEDLKRIKMRRDESHQMNLTAAV